MACSYGQGGPATQIASVEAEPAPVQRRGDLGPKLRINSDPGRPLGTIKLQRSKTGHLIVPVELGNSTFDFVLDTGASITVITPSTRDTLGISADAGVPVRAAGANGSIDSVRVVDLPAVTVAGRKHKGLQAAVMDLEHLERPLGRKLPGILGQNFLATHRLELDFPTETLIFHPAAGDAPEFPSAAKIKWQSFKIASLIQLRVSIDGSAPFPAVLDLGAGRSIINWKAAALAGLKPEDELENSPEPLLGADAQALQLRTHAFESLSFGKVNINSPQLYIGDIGVFDTLGISDGPAMVLGIDLLNNRRVLIDYTDHVLLVSI